MTKHLQIGPGGHHLSKTITVAKYFCDAQIGRLVMRTSSTITRWQRRNKNGSKVAQL